MNKIKIICSLFLFFLLVFNATLSYANDEIGKLDRSKERNVLAEAGLGMGSFLLTSIYSPLKISYSVLGIVIGGFAYGLTFGNSYIAGGVLDSACRGTYIITPQILLAEEPLYFIGSKSNK